MKENALFCNVVEDEYHFVLECNMYLDLREKYISKYYWKRPNMHKFVELINSNNENRIRKLNTFVCHAFKLHSEYYIDGYDLTL